MERTFDISVRGKIAKNLSKTFYVCGNSDYAAHFDFDAEWDEHQFKTARFIGGDGTHYDRIFSGNECEVPVFMDTYQITVGVFAGNLRTTTPAIIPAKRSILSGGSAPAVPPKDDYAQMMEEINSAAERAEKAAERAEEIAEAIAGGGEGSGSDLFLPSVSEEDNGKVLTVVGGEWAAENPPESGVNFETDETLALKDGVLSVNTTDEAAETDPRPITAQGVYNEFAVINALLKTI